MAQDQGTDDRVTPIPGRGGGEKTEVDRSRETGFRVTVSLLFRELLKERPLRDSHHTSGGPLRSRGNIPDV